MSDHDYQFLAASQALDKREIQKALDLKEEESRILAKANEEANRKIKRANISIGLGSAVLFIMLIVGAISWIYTWQKVKKAEQQVAELNQKIAELNQKVAEMNKQINNRQFYCGMSQGYPATIVRTVRGPMPIIIWTNEDYIASGWSPERRCKEISYRFERFNRSGQLKYVTTGTVDGQPVICSAISTKSSCSRDTVLLTLPSGTDAKFVRKKLLNTRLGIALYN